MRTFDEHPVVQALRLAHAELPEEEEVREEMGLYHLAKMYRAYVDGKVDIPPELRRAALSSIRSERGWGENEEPDIPLNRLEDWQDLRMWAEGVYGQEFMPQPS